MSEPVQQTQTTQESQQTDATDVESTRLARSIGLSFGDLFRDRRDGMTSVVKTLSVSSWFVITAILLWESYYHSISSFDLLMYSMTTTICSGAPLASHVISLTQPRLAGAAGKYAPKENGATKETS